MSLLSVRDLTKRFGTLTAVDDAAFDIEDGEFVSILGPSGSGKSTILRMVAGFESPTEGEITLAGSEITDVPPFERDINMVFQNLALFPHLTVAKNIGYGLKQRGVPKAERAERTERMLEMVHLEGYGDRNPNELSGGEQQRVALARALVNEPALVLFDEPLSSLDRKLRQHMQGELQRIQAETGITFLYVTHDQEVAMAVSDRLIVLNEGEIEQIGPVEELYDDPESKFVADFIGDVNVLPATVAEAEADTVTIETDGQRVRVPTDRAWSAGDAVHACIRPHNLHLAGSEPAGTAGFDLTTRGVIRNRSYQGSDTIYTVETEWGRLTADVREGRFDLEEAVAVGVDGDDVHLFGEDETARPVDEPTPTADAGGD